jgi:hypothetical protein
VSKSVGAFVQLGYRLDGVSGSCGLFLYWIKKTDDALS